MIDRRKYKMTDRVELWLKQAPMPDAANWLRSLYVDNILLVSANSENRWAEYGKKLIIDEILGIQRELKNPVPKSTLVESGEELLGVLHPIHKEEDY